MAPGDAPPRTVPAQPIATAAAAAICLAGLLAGLALAASPSATTGAATNVTPASATVSGTVDPNGESATYTFQFGTTAGYGSQTNPQPAGSGTDGQPVSRTLAGLVAGTTYHYRLVATNASGSTVGTDRTFTTTGTAPPPPKSPPPVATTGGSDRVGRHTARVHGTVNPKGARTTFYFELGLTAAYDVRSTSRSLAAGTSLRSVSGSFTGLQSGRTYHYRLVARNAGGVGLGRDRTFRTKASRTRLLPSLTVRIAPGQDRRAPFRFEVRGKLLRPAGVSRSRGCRGRVVIRFKSRAKTLRLRRVRLSRKCRYRAAVRVPVRRPPRTLRVKIRFRGNSALKPRSAPTLRVVAGR